jgi:adenylate cyclase
VVEYIYNADTLAMRFFLEQLIQYGVQMAGARIKRRLSAILCADVVGYSRLMSEDEATTLHTLKRCIAEIIEPTVQEYNGRIFKRLGDGFLVEFSSAVDSVECAIAWQKEIQDKQYPLMFRIGINLGDVIPEGEDMYGDGVNIAARIEGLANPGDICISRNIYEQISKKIDLGYEYLGEQRVKNISEPIGVYKLLVSPEDVGKLLGDEKSNANMLRWGAAGAIILIIVSAGLFGIWRFTTSPQQEPAVLEKMAFKLPDKPSIAVLPFLNMSDDPDQEYFVDGMTEDLITDLSQMSGLFVIARNSTFLYKGKSAPIGQVSEELGVRYVLEGSVRKAGEQVRINTQLIDATTGEQLWAKRYDGRLDNIFALQDKITQKIFAALAVELSAGEKEKVGIKETDSIEAYDAFLKGWELYRKWTPEDFHKSLPFFEKAIELDPQYGKAYAAIASVYTEGYQSAWDWSHVVGVSAEAMPGLAGKYLKEALKYPTTLAHQVASKWYVILLFPDEAIASAEKAIALDPNDAVGYEAMAWALIYSGKPEDAIDYVNKAIRLDPLNIANYLYTLGTAYFGMEQYQKAVSFYEKAFKLNPELGLVQRAYLAASYVYLDMFDKAKAELNIPEIRDVRELYDLYVEYEAAYYKNPEDSARLVEVLKKVGLDSVETN